MSHERKLFLSHAEEDGHLAAALRELLRKCGADVFLGVTDLRGCSDWRSTLHSELETRDLLVLYTRHGARSPWMHYEIGVAIGKGRSITVAKTELPLSVKADRLPGSTHGHYDLMRADGITSLVRHLLPESDFDRCLMELNKVRLRARGARCFIAGSVPPPQEAPQFSVAQGDMAQQQPLEYAIDFITQDIVQRLIEQRCTISCNPEIVGVGRSAFRAVLDRAARESPEEVAHISAGVPTELKDAISRARDETSRQKHQATAKRLIHTYLYRQDVMIVIGGGVTTRMEIDTAVELGIPVVVVPITGGTAAEAGRHSRAGVQVPWKIAALLDGGMLPVEVVWGPDCADAVVQAVTEGTLSRRWSTEGP